MINYFLKTYNFNIKKFIGVINANGTSLEILGSTSNSKSIFINKVEITHQENKLIKYLNPDLTKVWLVLKVQ